MNEFDHRVIGDVRIVALSRHGGASRGYFESLNVASYVGDDPQDVARNIESAGKLVGVSDVAVMNAAHSAIVHVIDGPGLCQDGDALITTQRNLGLLALSADCVTVALVDTAGPAIAVVHAGWRGVLSHVVVAAVNGMVEGGAQTSNIKAVVGPSICANCYEVSAELVNQFRFECEQAVHDDRHLNLANGVFAQLSECEISSEVMTGCTFENDDLFSYRRAGGLPTGRGGLIVARTESS